MQDFDPKAYFTRRAEEEQAAAERAGDERAARSHRDLARLYANLANGGVFRSDTGGVEEQCSTTLPKEFRIVP